MPHYDGPIDTCKIAIVGEALGEEEERAGRPFVGRSGQLLDSLLNYAKIRRSDCYVTNVFSFRPTRNDIAPYIKLDSNKDCASFESETYQRELARLKEELSKCSANVIVALGRVALWALTGHTKISNWRGSVVPCTLVDKKVVPAFHPAAILRGKFIQRFFLAFDLDKARKQSEFREIRNTERTLIVNPSFYDILDYLEESKQMPEVGFDIETSYIRGTADTEMTHFAVANSASDAICVPLFSGGKDNFDAHQEEAIIRSLGELLKSPTKIIGQNLMFDCYFMLDHYKMITTNKEDTMIAMGIAYPDFPKDLGFICSLFTNEPYYKEDRKKHAKGLASETTFREYNCKDAAVCLEALPLLRAELQRQGNLWYYQHKMDLTDALLHMEYYGVLMDKPKLDTLAEDAAVKLDQLQAQINLLCGREINPKSPKQLVEYFYEIKKIKPYLKDKRPTTDKDALKRLELTKGIKEAGLINKYRSLSTRRSTFYTIGLSDDGRLRSDFQPIGAESRLSSRRTIFDTGSNMQNLPPEVKACMMADPDHLIINMDLSQAENRVVAYIWGVTKMIQAFEEGVDIHSATAGLIFNKLPSEISREKGSTSIGGGVFSERDVGKKANHSLNYGEGPEKFSITNDVSLGDARFMVDSYFKIYPEIKQGHRMIETELKSGNPLVNLLGRKRWFKDYLSSDLFTKGYSYIPQSTVGDVMNMRGLVFAHNSPTFNRAKIVNQVHDSIVFIFPIKEGKSALMEAIYAIKESLETPLVARAREFSIPVDLAVGYNLGKYHEDKNPRGYEEISANEYSDPGKLDRWLSRIYERA